MKRIYHCCIMISAQTPNSMGRNIWAEQLQIGFLSNCILYYLVFMVAAHVTCYQNFRSKISMVHAYFEK